MNPALRSALAVGLALAATLATAQDPFPSRPIRIVVPFGAGGGPDIMARLVAQKMSASMNHPVVVDNRAGATGLIGSEHVAKSAPDGHTLLLGTPAPMTIAGAGGRKINYDPIKDFAGVTQGAILSPILVVAANAPYKTVADLIAHAKVHGAKMNYGSAGIGNSQHLAGELFNQMAGLNVLHVPYAGTQAGLLAIMNAQTDYYFSDPSGLPHVRSGKLKALAVSTLKRSRVLPDVPTVHESGLPNYEYTNWYGFVVPAKTPRPILMRLHKEITDALKAPDLVEKLITAGMEPSPSTPEELDAFLPKDLAKWAQVIKAANIKFE